MRGPGGTLIACCASRGPGGALIACCAMLGLRGTVAARYPTRGPGASRTLRATRACLPTANGPTLDTASASGAPYTGAGPPPSYRLSCRAKGVPPAHSPSGSSSPTSHDDVAGGWCSSARGSLGRRRRAGDLSCALFRPHYPNGHSLAPHDGKGVLLTLLSAPICIPQAHGSCSFSLRVFPQGLSIRGSTKNYLKFSI